MTEWISLRTEKPPEGEYVLIWVPSRPWRSRSATVFSKVAMRIVDDGVEGWQEFGPGIYDEDEITHWARITVPTGHSHGD